MPEKKDDTPQFEKDAKATRNSFLAKLILGRMKEAEAAPPPTPAMGSANPQNAEALKAAGMKRGGSIKKFAKGGSVDGIAQRGKTRGKYI